MLFFLWVSIDATSHKKIVYDDGSVLEGEILNDMCLLFILSCILLVNGKGKLIRGNGDIYEVFMIYFFKFFF
jgi:hypothetical protein